MRQHAFGVASTPWPCRLAGQFLWAVFGWLTLGAVVPAGAQGAIVQGFVTYEKVPATLQGLRFGASERRPVGGATMELVAPVLAGSDTPFQVVGRAITDDSGFYQILASLPEPTAVYLRVRAESENARVYSLSDSATYAYRMGDFLLAPDGTVSQEVALTDSDRSAGPFNILADIRAANAMVRAAAPGTVFPTMSVGWTPTYRGGSFYMPSTRTLVLNGDRSVNSDEYDDSVILHEYGHFLDRSFSRDESPGGTHIIGNGDRLDPRLAFGEGWADFFAQAVQRDPGYVDTMGNNGSLGWGWNLEQNVPVWDNPGYWSEATVSSVLWDLFDAAADEADDIALGFAPIWKALSGGLRNESQVYLIDFCDVLARDNAGRSDVLAGLTAILQQRRIAYTPGGAPSVPNPYPTPLAANQSVTGSLDSTIPDTRADRWDLWSAVATYTFTLPSDAAVDILLEITGSRKPATADLDLYLLKANGAVALSSRRPNGVGGTERVSDVIPAGTYLIQVWSASYAGGYYYNAADFRLTLRY